MMSRPWYTPEETEAGIPIFLLDITWGGIDYHLATLAVTVDSDDGEIQYTAGLQEFTFKESADFVAIDVEANILSCSLMLPETVNLLQEWAKGNVLEGSRAVFSYVVWRQGSVVQTYENRIILMQGQIQEPQFGDPAEPDNFVALSVEQSPLDSTRLLLDNKKFIDDRFPARDLETADGKPYPIIIGIPGYSLDPDGTAKQLYSTPAYCIQDYTSHHDAEFLIAGHVVGASYVRIQDDNFRNVNKLIERGVDSLGNEYSYVTLGTSDNVALPGYFGSGDSRTWFCTWTPSILGIGGGMLNPYGDGYLTGGGDLCRWAIHKTGQLVDDGAWANIAPILNRYEFSGYINDPEVTAWEWLQGNILPFLPITIRSGPNGLRPVLNQLEALIHIDPITNIDIDDTGEFYQLSAVDTITNSDQIINRYTLNYAKVGYSQDYAGQVRCTNFAEQAIDIPSDYAETSVNRYGIKEGSASTDYIYDRGTAEIIALQQVRASALVLRAVDISAPFHYGFLQIGDILAVTSTRLFLSSHKMIVGEKEWLGQEWRLRLIFEDNPIQNQRS
jgi:hypothetical protein